jgi:hypothetical protein
MTTETTAFMIGYGFFTLILALLIYAWRRESRLLGITKENLFRSYDQHEGTFKMLNEALNEKQIISNKNAILELKDKEQDKLFESLARINQNLIDANNQLESELDRGNEMITWMKADLEKAYKLNAQNELVINSLLINGKLPDENGEYKKLPWFEHGFYTEVGHYINSRVASRVAKYEFDHKRNSVASTAKGIDHQLKSTEGEEKLTHNDLMKQYVDDFLKSPDLATGHMKSVIEIKPDEPIHDFEKIADQATQPLADAIDWNVPQAFPNDYVVPEGIKVVWVDSINNKIPLGTKGITEECGTLFFVDWENSQYRTFDQSHGLCAYSENLAPINPTDHPLHPEFKNKAQ